MSRITLLLLFCTLVIGHLSAQTDDQRIRTIDFEGVEKTKVSFLSQFIQCNPGTIPADSLIQADIQRLKNIPGIGNATYRVDQRGKDLYLVYQIEEVRTFLPIANFGGIKGNFWFQLGFSDINWQGKGQFLSAHYQNNDQRHSGQIFYRVPYFRGSQWGFTANLSMWASREPLFFEEGTVNYDYDNNSLGLSAIRYFGLNRSLELGGTYFVEKYAKSKQQFLENPPGPESLTQPKWLLKVEYNVNLLNYHFFYLKGRSWRLRLQDVYNTLDKNWFHSLQFQGRQFFRVKDRGNLALRLRLAISTNNDTPFAPFVADSHVNLRGVGNRIDRGTAQVVLNVEYRQTLFESRLWAAQAVAFTDVGTWRKPGGTLSDLWNSDQFREFVGGGFRIIYQKIYGAVFRIDYGIDVFNPNQRGLVIGLGQYF
ncbi:MAG: BamA/TamA family outer membrane protein [Bacteroidota bacterium]